MKIADRRAKVEQMFGGVLGLDQISDSPAGSYPRGMDDKPKRRLRVPRLVAGMFGGLGVGLLILPCVSDATLTAQPIVVAVCVVMGLLVGFILDSDQRPPAARE